MPDTKKITCRMDYDYAANFLASLPGYCEVTIECYNLPDQKLMARDRPAPGRRFTNLTSGTEWFITAESLQNITATNILIHPFTIACTY